MKVIALFATVNAGVLAFTPQASPRLSTKLEARRDEGKRNNFVGGALAFVAGIATAGQVAFADPAILMDNTVPAETQNIITQSSLTVSIGAPTFGGGSSFETLDFSLPSYSESTGGASDGAVKKNEPPSFKADFPELKLPSEEKKADDGKAEADAKKEAEDKAAAKKAAEEEKAAKAKAAEEAKIQKEKEAAEKAEKEEKRKAEIAARKEAEKKKQEEMVARQKAADEKAAAEKKAAEEKAAAEAEKPKVEEKKEVPPPPAAPKAPEIKAPEVAIPAFTAPKIEAPKVEIPKFEAPKFEVPAAPKAVYDLDIKSPSLPDIKTPSVPSFGGSTSDEPKAPLEPQEVRDEKARQAKDKFKKLDEELKEIEKKAAAARELAKEAKKEAKDAKDLACETRPGGKILCLRSPGIGY